MAAIQASIKYCIIETYNFQEYKPAFLTIVNYIYKRVNDIVAKDAVGNLRP
jgi:hypothetical protein